MQHDDPQAPKRRPRARTVVSLPALLKGRKSDSSAVASSQEEPVPNLPLDDLIAALQPPAVLSPSHARALVSLVQTVTPRLDQLSPVISRLCAPGVRLFLPMGLEIISAYAVSRAQSLDDIERASLFSILKNSDSDWTSESWAPRLKCLSKLTDNGCNVTGFGESFFEYAIACGDSAFQGLLSGQDSDRIPREKFLEDVSSMMRESLKQNAFLYSEQNFHNVLSFFERLVRKSLDKFPSEPQSVTASIPSPVTLPSPSTHRRNMSSMSGITYPGSRLSHPQELVERTLFPISLYTSFLDMYHSQLTPTRLPTVISTLLCIIAVHLTPLPRLSAWGTPHHHPHAAEESALNHLFALVVGSHSDTVVGYIKRSMTSSSPQEALGAFRAVRAVLRDAAESRMALLALRRPKYDVDEYAHSGQLVISDVHAGVLQRAHREGLEVPSLTVGRLVGVAGKAVRQWVAERTNSEKILEESLGMVKDVLTEASDRVDEKDDTEDYSAINVDEERFVGAILAEAVKCVQWIRLGKDGVSPSEKHSILREPVLPIDKPSMATTPLLLVLCTQLALPLSTPMVPTLPSILLSIASHLTDTQTATMPNSMYALGLLTPTSLAWLDNISDLFTELVSRERPITSKEVFRVVETIHEDLSGVSDYRRRLGQRVCELIESVRPDDDGSGMDGDESWARLCVQEFVSRIMESVQDEVDAPAGRENDSVDDRYKPGDEQSTQEYVPDSEAVDLVDATINQLHTGHLPDRIIRLFISNAERRCPCQRVDVEDAVVFHHQPVPQEIAAPQTLPVSVATSNPSTPESSRVASDVFTQAQDTTPTHHSSVLPLKSILSNWTNTHAHESKTLQSPVTIRSETTSSSKDNCLPVNATIALINTFQEISFAAIPNHAYSVRVFNALLHVLRKASCPRARLAMLQLLMRLRADRDHRLFILSNIDNEIHPLAAVADRSRLSSRDMLPEEGELHRSRSTSHRLRRGRTKSPLGSRSRSRPGHSVHTTPARPRINERLWMVPETLPFNIPLLKFPSDGVTTYEANAPTEWEELKHWLPISDYVLTLAHILRDETDWEILSYVLCHLPVQLANKHFFCGPKTKSAIVSLLVTLCTVTFKGEAANVIAEQMPESLRLRDAQGLIYHSLVVLVSYRRIFDERRHHDMLVDAFLAGLSSQPSTSTAKLCLNALSLCAYELPSSITKNLSHIMDLLSRVMTNAEMAVHILDFVSIVGSLPSLYSNFREQEFKMVFNVAVKYIHYHNSPDDKELSGRESFALSQHVLVVAYYIIYVWFLAVPLPDRPKYVPFLSRGLLLANEANGAVDEPTEVCFDWLARYTYATADPKPAQSMLGDVVMKPPHTEKEEPVETPSSPKVWLWGNSLVTIRTMPKRGWIEVESVRPSGVTRFLCKLENFPQVNPGDVDPDMLSDHAIIMSDRDPAEMEMEVPDPEDHQDRDSTGKSARQDVHDIFIPGVNNRDPEERPDPVTGYVWSQSAPSQRRKDVSIDPSFFALQLSQFPHLPKPTARSRLVPPSTQLDTLLRTLKHTPVIDMHKIAILYVAPGQREERDILGNRHGSPAYSRFLEGIGRLVRIRDQRDVYTGDIIPETDGEYAYAWWDDIVQVIYHTATLMPNIPVDPHFNYKKRHVGNDKVRIVWNDSGLPYALNTIMSDYNFVNLIVEPHSTGTIAAFSNNKHEHEFFKITMQRMEGMPAFGPIGDFKVVSAENLPSLLRQMSLLADFFSEVYEATDKDTSRHEYVTNWRRRLQYINTFRSRIERSPIPDTMDEDAGSLIDVRDFTRFF